MANIDELKRLGERFPNKNVGCGNPNAKIGSSDISSDATVV